MHRSVVLIGILGIALALLLYMLNLYYGNLNQDEGWYLYAAKQVSEGQTLYADFSYPQGPVLPYVYGGLYGVVREFGVAGGRFLTALFGLSAALFAAGLAGRLAPNNKGASAVAAFLLIGCNTYHSYFTTVVKTYGLCSMLLMAGFFVLSFRKNHQWGGAACLISGVLLSLAAGTWISVGIVLPIIGVWLILRSREEDVRREECGTLTAFLGQRFNWVFFGIGGGSVLLALFVPFLLISPEQYLFDMFGYHAGRNHEGLLKQLVLKAGFISRFVQAYFLFTILTLSVVFIPSRHKGRIMDSSSMPLWVCGIAITLPHISVQFPYDDYQVVVFPILGAALALSLMRSIDSSRAVGALAFLLFASIAGAFSSPINQDWFVRGRDRLWLEFKEKSDLALLRDAARVIRENSSEDSSLLTQDTYLAVEANRSVPVGMEMGAFCYYPDMPSDQAKQLRLLNREMLLKTISETEAPFAAFSGYGFAIEKPSLAEVPSEDVELFLKAVRQRYDLEAHIPYFGQAHTSLEIYKLRDSE